MQNALRRLTLALLLPVLLAPGGVSARFCIVGLSARVGGPDCCCTPPAADLSAAIRATAPRAADPRPSCCRGEAVAEGNAAGAGRAPLSRNVARGVAADCPLCVHVAFPERPAAALDPAKAMSDFFTARSPSLHELAFAPFTPVAVVRPESSRAGPAAHAPRSVPLRI